MKIGDTDWRVLMDQIDRVRNQRDAITYEMALAVQRDNPGRARQLVPDFAAKDAELDRLYQAKDEQMRLSA